MVFPGRPDPSTNQALSRLTSEVKRDPVHSTRHGRQAVPDPSTNQALSRLTSEVKRDPVHSTRYGRQRQLRDTVNCVGRAGQKIDTLLDLCVASLRRGHANLLCIFPILTDDLRRESTFARQGLGSISARSAVESCRRRCPSSMWKRLWAKSSQHHKVFPGRPRPQY